MKKYILISTLLILSTVCSKHQKESPITNEENITKRNQEIRDLTLQYRISMDAVAPSKFIAIYKDGMTLGLKIHWKISETKKQELDQTIKQLEDQGLNGKEFIAKGRWLHEGYELEIFEIKEKFNNSIKATGNKPLWFLRKLVTPRLISGVRQKRK